MRLNPAQEAAVRHRGGPLLVLAGAGTGKTRVITHRVAALLREGVPAWRILAVTFTNKAAAEMRERIAALCPERDDLLKELWVGTFHSICARILRRWGEPVGLSRNFTIYDTSDQLSVMKRVLRDLQISPDLATPQAVLTYLDRSKNQGGGAEGIARRLKIEPPLGPVIESAARLYQRLVRAADAADFGDLLVLTVNLLEGSGARLRPETRPLPEPPPPIEPAAPEPALVGPLAEQLRALHGALRAAPVSPGTSDSQLGLAFADLQRQLGDRVVVAEQDPIVRLRRRFTHIVVDEYQDTNPVQAALIELLGERAELCVVGDDDQSIYGWRGADVAQILGFPERHPDAEVIRLEQNYRSTNHILGCANGLIRRNSGRFGKALFSELGDGAPVQIVALNDEVEEARAVVRAIQHDLASDHDAAPPQIAVFYRTHAQSRIIEEVLRHDGVRYAMYGGLRFLERREIKDLLSYLRLLINPASDVDLQRIINVPPRHIGDTTMNRVQEHATQRQISLSDALLEAPAIGLATRACRQIAGFVALIDALRAQAEGQRLDQIAEAVLEATGYRDLYINDPSEEARDRLENIQEFVGSLKTFAEDNPEKTLADYLEGVALDGNADNPTEDRGGSVTLMTIHSAKGLEFDHVYLTGMEERVFPHARVLDDPEQMEEERRLAYVAVTRARRRLIITWARQRRLYGQTQLGERSRFLREMPAAHLHQQQPPQAARPAATRSPPASFSPYEHTPRARPVAAKDPTWDSDITYDDAFVSDEGPARARGGHRSPPAADEGVPLYIGMRVKHRSFGEGELLGWDGAGEHLKLTLRFPGVGPKTILARFCEPA